MRESRASATNEVIVTFIKLPCVNALINIDERLAAPSLENVTLREEVQVVTNEYIPFKRYPLVFGAIRSGRSEWVIISDPFGRKLDRIVAPKTSGYCLNGVYPYYLDFCPGVRAGASRCERRRVIARNFPGDANLARENRSDVASHGRPRGYIIRAAAHEHVCSIDGKYSG